jgi:hypothetical protein
MAVEDALEIRRAGLGDARVQEDGTGQVGLLR